MSEMKQIKIGASVLRKQFLHEFHVRIKALAFMYSYSKQFIDN
jgi:hypothetical protein